MPLDQKAKSFLGNDPVTKIEGSKAGNAIINSHAEYRQREFLARAGTLYESVMGHFLQERKKHEYTDDESIAAVALFAINLRHAYGEGQTPKEKTSWTQERRDAKHAEFDAICEAMQAYFDSNGAD